MRTLLGCATALLLSAGGAWADELGALLGARPIGLLPHRRSAFTFKLPDGSTRAVTRDLGARMFLRGLASPLASAGEMCAPRYRQAAIGAFLTTKPEGQPASCQASSSPARERASWLATWTSS